jgi:hypothetical protein
MEALDGPMTAEIREVRASGAVVCSTRGASKVPDVFRVGILVALRAGQSIGRPSATAARCRLATRERGRSQFSEALEVTHAAGPLNVVQRPTALQRVIAGSAAAASAYS